ncbi:MAG: sigma-54-dependent transcriptional regulator [Actinomycetes bacterium]
MVLIREPRTIEWADALERALATHPDHGRWNGFGVVASDDVSGARRVLSQLSPDLRGRIIVVLETSAPTADQWGLLDAGAGDVVGAEDPDTVDAVLARLQRWASVEAALGSRVVRDRFVGESPSLKAALRDLVELALFGRAPVMLAGETGTGKELAAQVVHELTGEPGERGRGELVVVDCTTIVPSLSGSELFGHERGAFTGADRARVGAVKQADGGTLFLDEVGELPVGLQAELLRVIQEGRFKTVGGSIWGTTAFRLVSATHRDLSREQRHGRFRHDLYHRIAASTVWLPPLRERLEDVPELFVHFLAEARRGERVGLTPGVRQCLCERDYPGNVRQLRQLALQVAARHVGPGPVTVGDIPAADRPSPVRGATPDAARKLREQIRHHLRRGFGLRELKDLVSDLAVEIALADAHGNTRAAAERLGITPRALQMRRHG